MFSLSSLLVIIHVGWGVLTQQVIADYDLRLVYIPAIPQNAWILRDRGYIR